jgi:hypothetical protein
MRNNLWKVPLFSALLSFSIATSAQQPGRVLVIEGQTGQAPVVEVGGRAYVEIEGLTDFQRGSHCPASPHIEGKSFGRRTFGGVSTLADCRRQIISGFRARRDRGDCDDAGMGEYSGICHREWISDK